MLVKKKILEFSLGPSLILVLRVIQTNQSMEDLWCCHWRCKSQSWRPRTANCKIKVTSFTIPNHKSKPILIYGCFSQTQFGLNWQSKLFERLHPFWPLSDRTPLPAPHTGWADKSVAKYMSATGPLHCGTGTAPCASLPIRPNFLLAIWTRVVRALLIQAVLDWFLNCGILRSMLRVKSSLSMGRICWLMMRGKRPFVWGEVAKKSCWHKMFP